MKLIFKYLKKYKKWVIIDIISVCSFALAELGIPTLVANIVNVGIANNDTEYMFRMAIIMVILALLSTVGMIVLGYVSSYISTSITRDIRNDMFIKTQSFSHAEYDKFGVSSLITRVGNDAFQVQQFVNVLLRTAVMAPFMFVLSTFLILNTSLQLASVIAITIPIIILGVIAIAHFSEPISNAQQKGMDRLVKISRENITGVRVIRSFTNDVYEDERFKKESVIYANNCKRLYKLMNISQPAFFLLLNLASLPIFYISANLINIQALQVGSLIAFMEYLFHAMFSIMLFSSVFIMYPRASVSANRIEQVLNSPISIKNNPNAIKEYSYGNDITLRFDNVSFYYPDSTNKVLNSISFSAKKGETIAFIGSTGSGKSTLIQLIPRFYDVSEGSIYINDININDYDLNTLRSIIGYIPQKAKLFSGTISDNIKLGKKEASYDELINSSRTAQAYEFINSKENKFNELLSEGGSNVSGGQKQRLSIARALIRKPSIYIFDDSFSALDYKTDATLRSALRNETKDAITLIVAQRISSIKDANKIIVLNEGHIIGDGTHIELLKNCSIYYEIAASQLSEEELKR
ncbi:MAG: ABC transporter ATP-binding protein [Erysipelotrichaceae bacterium]